MFEEKHGPPCSSKMWINHIWKCSPLVQDSIYALLKVVFDLQTLVLVFKKLSQRGP